MRKLCPLLMIVLLPCLLSACGWQLQGSRQLPAALSPVYLELHDEQSILARQLRLTLQMAEIQTAVNRAEAASILRINYDAAGHTVTSVSALNEPQQYEVFYRAEYSFTANAGSRTLVPVQGIGAQRTMSYDKTLALAKLREEQTLSENLAQELAQQILRRITMLPAVVTAP